MPVMRQRHVRVRQRHAVVLVPLRLVQRHVDALLLPGSARRRGEGGEGEWRAGALPLRLLPMPEKKPMLAVARVVAGVGAGVARWRRGASGSG